MKISTIGGDGFGWALDEDIRTFLFGCSTNNLQQTNLNNAVVVFSPWWVGLAEQGSESLVGKKIICGLDNPIEHWLSRSGFSECFQIVGLWIVHSKYQLEYAKRIGLNVKYVPYSISKKIFPKIEIDSVENEGIREKFNLPKSKYIIANFQRDTDGRNLTLPKLQKGPDIFVAVINEVYKRNKEIHVLLAGPRRHWIIAQLESLSIPYTYIGKKGVGDDLIRNMMQRKDLQELYHAVDLCLFTSRWEGGPYGLLEAISCRRKVLSTSVGIAEDILNPYCIYKNIPEVINKILSDITYDDLNEYVNLNYEKIQLVNSEDAVIESMKNIKSEIQIISELSRNVANSSLFPKKNMNKIINRIFRSIHKLIPKEKKRISIFRKYVKPPYGGGNQFMLALKKEFEKKGYSVVINKVNKTVDAYLFDSLWFDKALLKKLDKMINPVVLHRIDGPIHLYRGKDKHLDDEIFEINKEYATKTVVQSNFTYNKLIEAGYIPKNPVVIHNAPDGEIFNCVSKDRRILKKVKLISSSWSSNPLKGEEIYKWLDEHLNYDKFDYIFVGNINCNFKNIKKIDPVGSEKLAEYLKSSDIYLTASRNDPCSNALIEALSCGLPAVFLNSGGHPELVGMAGLPFDDAEEIPEILEQIIQHYESYTRCIALDSISEIADRYLESMGIL